MFFSSNVDVSFSNANLWTSILFNSSSLSAERAASKSESCFSTSLRNSEEDEEEEDAAAADDDDDVDDVDGVMEFAVDETSKVDGMESFLGVRAAPPNFSNLLRKSDAFFSSEPSAEGWKNMENIIMCNSNYGNCDCKYYYVQ